MQHWEMCNYGVQTVNEPVKKNAHVNTVVKAEDNLTNAGRGSDRGKSLGCQGCEGKLDANAEEQEVWEQG